MPSVPTVSGKSTLPHTFSGKSTHFSRGQEYAIFVLGGNDSAYSYTHTVLMDGQCDGYATVIRQENTQLDAVHQGLHSIQLIGHSLGQSMSVGIDFAAARPAKGRLKVTRVISPLWPAVFSSEHRHK